MKKKKKTLCIEENKAYIIGFIISLIYSIPISFLFSSILNEAGLGNGKVTTMTLAGILQPILFIVFGILTFIFIIFINICGTKKKK